MPYSEGVYVPLVFFEVSINTKNNKFLNYENE